MIRTNGKIYIKTVALALALVCFASCSGGSRRTDAPAATTESQKQQMGELYENAGAKAQMMPRDRFNLTLSHNGYFYTEDIFVEISSDVEGAEIYYSLDGSVPSRDNVNTTSKFRGSKPYTRPILLDSTSYNEPHVLKVKAYSKESESRVLTHTYFVSFKIADRFDKNTYVFSISSEPDNLYGYENGIFVEGKLRDEWQKANPGQWANPPEPANYNLKGREAEKESYVEVLDFEGRLLVSQGAGVRVHGGWSRAADRKSIRLYARAEYDNVFDKFYYPFFEDNRRNDEYRTYIREYSNILLRNGANDRWGAFMREELAQDLAKKAGFLDYKDFAPAAVFVNGEYFGFYWLENFYNDDYFMDKYDVDAKGLVDIMEWEEPRVNRNDFNDDETFSEFCEIVDIDNYIQHYAFQIYARNWDWPHNNKKLWRYAEEGGEYINRYLDKKYRVLLYDAEGGWGDWAGTNERTIQRIKNDGSSPVFTALMKRPDMQEKFCNQMFDLLNNTLSYDSIESSFDRLVELYDHEIKMATKSGALPNDMQNVKNSRKDILRFAQKRENYVIGDMVKSFKVDEGTYGVNVEGDKNADLVLNTLKLSGEGNLRSCYFLDHSVTLEAKPHPGYMFDFWEINGTKYHEQKMQLGWYLAKNGAINAKLYTKPDAEYDGIVINTIIPDDNTIVLFNPGANETLAVDFYLSNDKEDLQKFHIKKVRFPPKSVMKYSLPEFRLKNGQTVYLSDREGRILCEVDIPKNFNMQKNERISRNSDGSYRVNHPPPNA